ncbi:DUF1360 domain-containing protein [bacterium]|nr:DUF1360 domain-containing protein [bacterium]
MNWTTLWCCFVIAVAASSISITISQTEIFAQWREWTKNLHPKLGYLFQCFYCIKHWIIFLGIAIYRPILVRSNYLLIDLTVSAFFTVTLSCCVSGILFKVFLLALAKKVREQEVTAMFAKPLNSPSTVFEKD